jgi:hypothetical protein
MKKMERDFLNLNTNCVFGSYSVYFPCDWYLCNDDATVYFILRHTLFQ